MTKERITVTEELSAPTMTANFYITAVEFAGLALALFDIPMSKCQLLC
jgi:hypothetical protein